MQDLTAKKKDAPRLPRPVGRYWKGRAPKGTDKIIDDLDSDVDEEETIETGDVLLQDDLQVNVDDDLQLATAAPTKAINISIKDVNISEEGKVFVHGKEETGRTALEQAGMVIAVTFISYANLKTFLKSHRRSKWVRGGGRGGGRRGRDRGMD